jgi:hypothetical protein
MRQATMVIFLASILVLLMQCSEKESLNSLMGRTEIASAAIDDTLYFIGPDSLLDSVIVYADPVLWLYKFPTAGSSSLSIIMKGWSQADLEIETYVNGVTGAVPLDRDSLGVFIDTVLIATTPRSNAVPPLQGSLLFAKVGDQILDTFPLPNPW